MANKKTKIMCIVLLIFIVFAITASAETFIHIEPFFEGESAGLERISVIEDSIYYLDEFVTEEEITENNIVIKDSQGNMLQQTYNTNYYILPFDEKSSIIEIYVKDNLVFSKTISFCNNNNLCEPCEGEECSLFENVLTCEDCTSGSPDFFCDLLNDGICDPDCNDQDADCSECPETGCFYKDQESFLECEKNFKGKPCKTGEVCSGDTVITDDVPVCCLAECITSVVEVPEEEIPEEDIKEPAEITEEPKIEEPEVKPEQDIDEVPEDYALPEYEAEPASPLIAISIAVIALVLISAGIFIYLKKRPPKPPILQQQNI
ncbi:hypothetical protein ACFL6I_15130 [candidate division KSB1 bacterium]